MMARMVPPTVHHSCASPGEREIFNRLKESPQTEGWYVLHSLDVAQHIKQVSGEIDFVIIVPSKGVLCLEVKACSSLRCENGSWYYGTNPHPDARGPFKQAATAMHSIRKRVTDLMPDLSGVPFWSAAAFPYVDFRFESAEWHPWQVIRSRDFRSRPVNELILEILDRARLFLAGQPNARWFDPESETPGPEQCKAIVGALRPSFEVYESPKSQSQRLAGELKHFTEEQFAALDAMEENPRVAFTGPAGTGKTLLAIESARRSRNAGRKALFLCFNRLLGKWLEEQTANLKPEVMTRTIHSRMLSASGTHFPGRAGREGFWERELPQRAVEKLLQEEGENFTFDEIIVDEVQDILQDSYLDFLDLSLTGGLAAGRWRLFGDFERQAVYGTKNLSLDEFLHRRGGGAPVYSLRTNCRNTPRIAAMTTLLGGLEPGYRRVLRPDDGIEPEIRYYSDSAEQQTFLLQTLEKLRAEGFKNEEIVILSPRAEAACAPSISVRPWKDRIKPLGSSGQGAVGYCSIHAFKGLESPAVVVTDVNRITDTASQVLFYVAISRALRRLVVIADQQARAEVLQLFMSRKAG